MMAILHWSSHSGGIVVWRRAIQGLYSLRVRDKFGVDLRLLGRLGLGWYQSSIGAIIRRGLVINGVLTRKLVVCDGAHLVWRTICRPRGRGRPISLMEPCSRCR
jgi:hypothetical protein